MEDPSGSGMLRESRAKQTLNQKWRHPSAYELWLLLCLLSFFTAVWLQVEESDYSRAAWLALALPLMGLANHSRSSS